MRVLVDEQIEHREFDFGAPYAWPQRLRDERGLSELIGLGYTKNRL